MLITLRLPDPLRDALVALSPALAHLLTGWLILG